MDLLNLGEHLACCADVEFCVRHLPFRPISNENASLQPRSVGSSEEGLGDASDMENVHGVIYHLSPVDARPVEGGCMRFQELHLRMHINNALVLCRGQILHALEEGADGQDSACRTRQVRSGWR